MFILIFIYAILKLHGCVFTNITALLFSFGNEDLFVIDKTGTKLNIYLNENKKFRFITSYFIIDLSHTNQTIYNVVPGDYDGDSVQDVLLILGSNNKSPPLSYNLQIYWGNISGFSSHTEIIGKIKDSPLIFDYNGDMLPDICAELLEDNLRYYWISNTDRTFHQILVTTEELFPMSIPNSNAYIDMNDDLTPDIFITSQSPTRNIDQFERWINKNGKFTRQDIYMGKDFWITDSKLDKRYGITRSGHSLFVDFNAAANMKHLMLACGSLNVEMCEEWAILAWFQNTNITKSRWEAVYIYEWDKNLTQNKYMIDFNYGIVGTNFPPGAFPPRMSIGDFNFDGYPDVLLILTSEIIVKNGNRIEKKFIRTPAILQNIPCIPDILDQSDVHTSNPEICNFLDRKLKLIPTSLTPDNNFNLNDDNLKERSAFTANNDHLIQNPVLAVFFDIYNDGLLDILVVVSEFESNILVENWKDNAAGKWKGFGIQAFKNNMDLDASFVKTLVLNGRCWIDCKLHSRPYGIIPPGAVVKYQTTYSKDAPTQAMSCQMMQTSHFALNLPYVIFGLGRRPNFIDKLEVGFSRPYNKPARYHNWAAIIPNSQMIIIPYPNNDSSKWQHILLLTPSYFIIKIGATLIATCLFLGMIIAILHWKEKREDFVERLRNAHQFHFDAL
ncbi:T-cell immunomodulatory protein-like isoform X2 [Gordionus sp. m RMFG-2023]|uniref:T-cell immunomodulatory protein-like isoform X2 n=1 Tax=Gordionus sp. m RMFG-2023 TaxID=3053472 RepID=UPI0031FD5FD6